MAGLDCAACVFVYELISFDKLKRTCAKEIAHERWTERSTHTLTHAFKRRQRERESEMSETSLESHQKKKNKVFLCCDTCWIWFRLIKRAHVLISSEGNSPNQLCQQAKRENSMENLQLFSVLENFHLKKIFRSQIENKWSQCLLHTYMRRYVLAVVHLQLRMPMSVCLCVHTHLVSVHICVVSFFRVCITTMRTLSIAHSHRVSNCMVELKRGKINWTKVSH